MLDKMRRRKRQIKAATKFVWRHLFTIGVMTWLVYRLGCGGRVPLAGALFFFTWAIIFDWVKMKKSRWGTGSHSRFERIGNDSDDWNPNIAGTPAYIRELGNDRHY
jgi:hypothetical protein